LGKGFNGFAGQLIESLRPPAGAPARGNILGRLFGSSPS